jgi:hypothetical protein
VRILSKIVTLGLIGLIALNIAGTAWYVMLQHEIRSAKPTASLAEGSKFQLLSGIDVQGAAWKSHDASCRVIRVTDDYCAFCKKDAPSYDKIVDAARRSSCEIIEISPLAQTMAANPRSGITQLQFVSGDIGTLLYPFVTPQTIVVDKDWYVKMTKRGGFDEQSLSDALSLIAAMSVPRLVQNH